MSKNCAKCGSEMSDDSLFCSVCGSSLEESVQGENPNPNTEPEKAVENSGAVSLEKSVSDEHPQVNADSNGNSGGQNPQPTMQGGSGAAVPPTPAASNPVAKRNAIIGIVAAAVVLILFITIISSILGNSYKKPVDSFFNGIEDADGKTFAEAFPDVMADELDDYADLDDILEYLQEDLEDEYGRNVKISFKVVEKEALDKDDIEDIEDEFKSNYSKRVDIDKAYKLDLDVTFKGKEDNETIVFDRIVVGKIDSNWYIVDMGDLSDLM